MIWDVESGECLASLRQTSVRALAELGRQLDGSAARSTAASAASELDGSLAAASADNVLRLWTLDPSSYVDRRRWAQPSRPAQLGAGAAILALVVLEDGLLAGGGYDATISLWNTVHWLGNKK